MSAIASFYVVPAERLTDVVTAATPVPGGWFRPARDTFWDVLRGSGRELERFAWSGWVFNTLDLYLESRLGFMYANFGDAHTSQQLSQARGSDWLVLPAASAVELLAALDGVECPADDVTAFVASEHGPDGTEEEAAAVHAALTTLKAWLGSIARIGRAPFRRLELETASARSQLATASRQIEPPFTCKADPGDASPFRRAQSALGRRLDHVTIEAPVGSACCAEVCYSGAELTNPTSPIRPAVPHFCSLTFASPVIRTGMLWHRRFDDQPAHLWLRKLVQQTAESQ
jgi:hypothetical protein